MRKLQLVAGLLTVLLNVPAARAQKGNWRAVMNLRPDTRISVKILARTNCFFQKATDDELVCAHHLPLPVGAISYNRRYDRRKIREVRLEESEATDAAVGAGVGASVGASVGAIAGGGSGATRLGGALVLGSIGALVGGLFGRDFPVIHGKVIYKR